MMNKRYVRDEQINKPDDFVTFIMNDYLGRSGYVQKQVKGEWLWKEGAGFASAPKFIKYSYENGVIHIEAFIRTLWLPGVYGKELDFTGAYGALVKQSFKKEIESLINVLYQPLPTDVQNGQQPYSQMQNGPVQVQCFDTSQKAVWGLVFSILALVFSLLVPLIGLILGIFGISNSQKGKTSKNKGMATAGYVIGLIAVIISVIIWILNFVLTFALL